VVSGAVFNHGPTNPEQLSTMPYTTRAKPGYPGNHFYRDSASNAEAILWLVLVCVAEKKGSPTNPEQPTLNSFQQCHTPHEQNPDIQGITFIAIVQAMPKLFFGWC
jgi:hypothetical protein